MKEGEQTKTINKDFWEEQASLSSLHEELKSRIEAQRYKIAQGDHLVQETEGVDDHDAWMTATVGAEMRKKAEWEITALNQLKMNPYQTRFDLTIEEGQESKDYRLYL